ncbi:MAG: class I SAM-dependent methyltransferase [Actinomycetota bacterium]|nr:class I SAM-dependent methyltransferase [Actinomycetota bacterium]
MTEQTPDPSPTDPVSAADHWERRYRDRGRTWSGNVNASLEREVTGLEREVEGFGPGAALDLGAGEGGDALWLARRGWRVTAVDISPTALAAGAAQQRAGDEVEWVAADLAEWMPPRSYDLVAASFLHSTVELPRERILRRGAEAVAAGGALVIIGHAGVPHWATAEHAHADGPDLPTPEQVLASLFGPGSTLVRADWSVVTAGLVERVATAPDGSQGSIEDCVVTLRRDGGGR